MNVEIWCEADPMEGYELTWEGILPFPPVAGDMITDIVLRDEFEWVVESRVWTYNENRKVFILHIYCKRESER